MADKLLSELNKGAWSSATAYTIGDIVSSSGSSYICVANSTNNTPPNATYWALLSSKGDQGIQGETGPTGPTGPQGVPGENGETTSPATNTADYIPQWDGANSKTLKNGLAVPAGGLAGLTALGDKVDKVTGKGLSTEDYSTAEKSKLSGIASGATANAKATGAEVDTGTDDNKFLTPKAVNDSHNIPDVAPGSSGNVMQSNGTDWVSGSPITGTALTAAPGTDLTVSGITCTLNANENQNFGDVCYIDIDGQAHLIDADAIASMSGLFMATATISANADGVYLALGFARNDAWAWTVGGLIYGTTTATTGNTLSQTPPSGTDDVVQILGVATSADRMYFNPQLVQVELV